MSNLIQNRAALAGLVAGMFGMLVLSALGTVIYTGRGLGEAPPTVEAIYPNL